MPEAITQTDGGTTATLPVADGALPRNEDSAPDDAALSASVWKTLTGAEPDTDGLENVKLDLTDAKEPEGSPTTEPSDEPPPSATPSPSSEKKPEAKPEKPAAEKKPADLDKTTRRKIVQAKEIVGELAGLSDEKMDAMNPDDLIEMGQRLAKVRENTEKFKTDMQKWKDRARGKIAKPTDTPDDGRGRSPDPDDEAEDGNPEGSTDGIDQLLGEFLDPDTHTKVKRQMRARESQFENRITEATARAEEAERSLIRTNLKVARGRVAEKFPDLNDDDAFRRLVAVIDEMDPQARHARDPDSMAAFMERVAWAEFGPGVERTTRQRLVTENRKDANGQPDTSSQSSPPVTMSKDEYDAYAFKASIEANGNQAVFDRIMAKVPKPK